MASSPSNPRRERRLILFVGVVASCMVLGVVTSNGFLHGGEDVVTHQPHHHASDHAGTAASSEAPPTPTASTSSEPTRSQPALPRAAAPIRSGSSNSDLHGRVAGKATFVTMSYPKSSRHHRLVEILKRVFIAEFEGPSSDADLSTARGASYGEVVQEGVLVWNGAADKIPATVTDIATAIGAGSTPRTELVAEADSAVERVIHYGTRFRILIAKANAVDNRWRIGAFLRTDIALSVDDDIDLQPEGAACLTDVRHSVTGAYTLVGIDVRAQCVHAHQSCKDHAYDKTSGKLVAGPPAGHGPYGYAARHLLPQSASASASRGGSTLLKHYSVVLPRAIVLTKELMHEYERRWQQPAGGRPGQQSVREIVDELKCDDIALNFVAANASASTGGGRGPQRQATAVYVKAKYRGFPEGHAKDSLTHQDGMKAKRQKCVNRLARLFAVGTAAAGGSVHENKNADPDAEQDALAVDDGVPRHRTWFVTCNVDG